MQKTRARTLLALVFLWLAVALAPGVEAASLFKCVGADGGVSYQSSACEAGAKLVWERPVEAGPATASSAAEGSAKAAGQRAAQVGLRGLPARASGRRGVSGAAA
jgi:hypothetical protein